MNGNRSHAKEAERPIAKPEYALPAVFDPRERSELPTRRRQDNASPDAERAHFYRKRTSPTGSPVYDFFITTDGSGRDIRQD